MVKFSLEIVRFLQNCSNNWKINFWARTGNSSFKFQAFKGRWHLNSSIKNYVCVHFDCHSRQGVKTSVGLFQNLSNSTQFTIFNKFFCQNLIIWNLITQNIRTKSIQWKALNYHEINLINSQLYDKVSASITKFGDFQKPTETSLKLIIVSKFNSRWTFFHPFRLCFWKIKILFSILMSKHNFSTQFKRFSFYGGKSQSLFNHISPK